MKDKKKVWNTEEIVAEVLRTGSLRDALEGPGPLSTKKKEEPDAKDKGVDGEAMDYDAEEEDLPEDGGPSVKNPKVQKSTSESIDSFLKTLKSLTEEENSEDAKKDTPAEGEVDLGVEFGLEDDAEVTGEPEAVLALEDESSLEKVPAVGDTVTCKVFSKDDETGILRCRITGVSAEEAATEETPEAEKGADEDISMELDFGPEFAEETPKE